MTGTGEELSVLLYKNKLKSREDGGKRRPSSSHNLFAEWKTLRAWERWVRIRKRRDLHTEADSGGDGFPASRGPRFGNDGVDLEPVWLVMQLVDECGCKARGEASRWETSQTGQVRAAGSQLLETWISLKSFEC